MPEDAMDETTPCPETYRYALRRPPGSKLDGSPPDGWGDGEGFKPVDAPCTRRGPHEWHEAEGPQGPVQWKPAPAVHHVTPPEPESFACRCGWTHYLPLSEDMKFCGGCGVRMEEAAAREFARVFGLSKARTASLFAPPHPDEHPAGSFYHRAMAVAEGLRRAPAPQYREERWGVAFNERTKRLAWRLDFDDGPLWRNSLRASDFPEGTEAFFGGDLTYAQHGGWWGGRCGALEAFVAAIGWAVTLRIPVEPAPKIEAAAAYMVERERLAMADRREEGDCYIDKSLAGRNLRIDPTPAEHDIPSVTVNDGVVTEINRGPVKPSGKPLGDVLRELNVKPGLMRQQYPATLDECFKAAPSPLREAQARARKASDRARWSFEAPPPDPHVRLVRWGADTFEFEQEAPEERAIRVVYGERERRYAEAMRAYEAGDSGPNPLIWTKQASLDTRIRESVEHRELDSCDDPGCTVHRGSRNRPRSAPHPTGVWPFTEE